MTKEHEIADIVVYLKLPSRETIKRKHTTALHKTAGQPGGEHGTERAAGCCDSLPAIPLVFADGSLRTHRLSLVGKIGVLVKMRKHRFSAVSEYFPEFRGLSEGCK